MRFVCVAGLFVACGSRSELDTPTRADAGPAQLQPVVCHQGDPAVTIGTITPIDYDHQVRFLTTDGMSLYGTSASLWTLPSTGGAPSTLGVLPANVLTAWNDGVYFNGGAGLEWIDHAGQKRQTVSATWALFVEPPEAFVLDAHGLRIVSLVEGTTLGSIVLSSGVTTSFALTHRYFHQLVTNGGHRFDNRFDRSTLALHDVVPFGTDDGVWMTVMPPAPTAACFEYDCVLDDADLATHMAYSAMFVDDEWTYSNNTLGFLRTNIATLAVEVLLPNTFVTAVAESNGCLYAATPQLLVRLGR